MTTSLHFNSGAEPDEQASWEETPQTPAPYNLEVYRGESETPDEFLQPFRSVEEARAFLATKGLLESEMWVGTRPGNPENSNPDPYYTVYIKGHNGITYDKGHSMQGINQIPLTYTTSHGAGKFSVHLAVDTIRLLKKRGLI